MTLQNICVSLPLAEEMKDLGFGQHSLFYYMENHDGMTIAIDIDNNSSKVFCAYTTSELGDMLPVDSRIQKGDMDNGEPADWYCSVNWKETSLREPKFEGDEVHTECGYTLADAMAKMLIYLKENDLLK